MYFCRVTFRLTLIFKENTYNDKNDDHRLRRSACCKRGSASEPAHFALLRPPIAARVVRAAIHRLADGGGREAGAGSAAAALVEHHGGLRAQLRQGHDYPRGDAAAPQASG